MKKIIICILAMILATPVMAKDNMMKIKMTFDNGSVVLAELNNTKTAQDLYAKLPLNIKMQKHNSQEFYANIILDKNEPTVDVYTIGDLAYWTPGAIPLCFFMIRGIVIALSEWEKS